MSALPFCYDITHTLSLVLTFYNRLGFAPTRQQQSSNDTLSARRSFPYRTLGVNAR
jgi:hypothetical protein